MRETLLDTDIYSEILRGVNAVVVANATAYRQAYGYNRDRRGDWR